MRLVSCHIDNFGKLSDYSIEFNPGVNNIVHDNGWGKSTLAAFIRVMFFGFDGEGKKAELQNERKRYTPWQSGHYGGELVFEQDGKKIKIIRSFAVKKGEKDKFSIESEDPKDEEKYSEKLGEEIFGIDAESFEKTVFVAQQDCETTVTDSIQAKIGDIEGQTAGMGNYKTVMKNLKAEEDRLNPKINTSEPAELAKELDELNEIIKKKETYLKDKEEIVSEIEKLENRRSECKDKQKELRERLTKLSRIGDKKGLYEKYQSLLEAENKAKSKRDKIAGTFPEGAPSQAEIDENINRATELRAMQINLSSEPLAQEEAERLEELKKEFAVGVPDDEDLRIASSLIKKIKDSKNETDKGRLSEPETTKLAEYRKRFAEHLPTEEEINSLKAALKGREEIRDSLTQLKGRAAAIKSSPMPESFERKGASLLPKKLMVLGIVLLLVAFIISILRVPIALGLLVALAGALLVFLSFVLGRKDEEYEVQRKALHEKNKKEELEEVLLEISEREGLIEKVDRRAEHYLMDVNGTYDEKSVSEDLTRLLSDIKEFEELEKRENSLEEVKKTINLEEAEKRIKEFFLQYMADPDDDYAALLQKISFDKKELLRLEAALEKSEEARKNYDSEHEKLTAFLNANGIAPNDDISAQIHEMKERFNGLQQANMDYNAARTDRQIFESSNDIESIKELGDIKSDEDGMQKLDSEFDELHSEEEGLAGRIEDMQNELSGLSERLEEIEKAEERYAEVNDELKVLEHKYEIILKTEDYLERAKNNFSDKYMSPIMAAYDKYYSMLSDDDKEYELDSDLNITFNEYGRKRDTGFLSEGYRDLVGLCRRMAMIEAMYESEKPFVILDDPFVNLDDKRIEGAKEFLSNLGENFQIIYLTCNHYRVA